MSRLERTDANLAAVLVVGALVVRGMAGTPSRELAELLALSAASGPLREAIGTAPLWDVLLWGWVQLLEGGAARLMSGVLAALQVGVVFLTARLLMPTMLSVVVALLVLLTPLTLGMSQDIRPDALLSLLVAASWGGWLAGWRGWAHSAVLLGAIVVSPWGALAVLPQAILRPQQRWIPLSVACLVALIFAQTGPVEHPRVLLALLSAFALDEPLSLIIVGLLGVGVSGTLQRSSIALAVWLVVPILAGMILGLDLRHAAVCLPALWLLAGQGLAGLAVGQRWSVAGLLLILGGLSMTHHVANRPARPDWDAMAAALPDLTDDDVIAAVHPEAWALVLSRPADAEITDAASAHQIADDHRGQRLLWLLGEDPLRHEPATIALLRDAVILHRIAAGGGEALQVCPGCRAADPSVAVFDPTGVREGQTLALYSTAAVVLPDLTSDGPGRYAVDVVARGTPAGGVPAKLEITLEGAQPDGDSVWSLSPEVAAHRVEFDATTSGAVVLRFLNDGTSGDEDRNVFIETVALSRQTVPEQRPADEDR
ncbi:MAG: hypothetical protein ACI8RZ_002454 [Myxococcota bacterium]